MQVSPRCHSLSIFVYVIFTMSKIVLRNVYVCLNVYLCPRLSIIVYECLKTLSIVSTREARDAF